MPQPIPQTIPQPIVVGCGAGFSADRLDPACALAESGRIACLVLECLGERTLAHGHRDRMADPAAGFNRYLVPRLRALWPICRRNGTRIITNMGAANPKAAADTARATARALGIPGPRIAAVSGADVRATPANDTGLPALVPAAWARARTPAPPRLAASRFPTSGVPGAAGGAEVSAASCAAL